MLIVFAVGTRVDPSIGIDGFLFHRSGRAGDCQGREPTHADPLLFSEASVERVPSLLFSLVLLGAIGCASPEPMERPSRPTLVGDRPAIGRLFDIDVRGGEGAAIRLKGVKGRVTAVCVLEDDAAGEVAAICEELAHKWRDRIAVVGLSLSEERAHPMVPFRVYRDPGGRVLSEILGLDPEPQILLLDVQGRIARWFPPGRSEELETAVASLVY